MTARHEDTPARREVRDRIRAAEPPNTGERAELIELINQKLTGQQRRDAYGFVKYRARTMKQLDNLRARLESL